ncbi:hypothetical protein N9595_04245 [Bacteroidia bacterium]|nr:hypothetical protein [Bacteroidia bacterium]
MIFFIVIVILLGLWYYDLLSRYARLWKNMDELTPPPMNRYLFQYSFLLEMKKQTYPLF